MKAPFGKRQKTTTDNARCFCSAGESYLQELISSEKRKKGSYAVKFPKYMERMFLIVTENDKKYPHNTETLAELSAEFEKHDFLPQALLHLELFEQEDRKRILLLVDHLFRLPEKTNQFAQRVALQRAELLKTWLENFSKAGMPVFYGPLIRMYSTSLCLCDVLYNVKVIVLLSEFVLNKTFDMSSEAYETLHTVLLPGRAEVEDQCATFLSANKEEIMARVFMPMAKDDNYFAKREGLKTLHEVLLREKYASLREFFVQEKENLIWVMQMLDDENYGIGYEAFVLLYVILTAPFERVERVQHVIDMNREKMTSFLKEFQQEREEADFVDKKNKMIAALSEVK